jgi:hypothetical protein
MHKTTISLSQKFLQNFTKLFLIVACVTPLFSKAQTTIINSLNATGTSGANGSFENATSTFAANGWSNVNGATNKWFAGVQSFCTGTKGAYVGTAAGDNNYISTTSDISHFYDDVTFPAAETCITLSFNWKGQGEGGWDGLRIYLGSTAVTPVAGTVFTTSDGSAVQLGNSFYNLQAACATVTITIPASNAGTTKRLVFSWQNDGSVGTNPAATIDAISLISQNATVPSCATALVPANLATAVTTCNALTWTAPASTGCNTATSYDVYFGTSATPPFVGNSLTTSYSVVMNYSTLYYWQIRPKNAAGTAIGCPIISFTTGAATNPQLNLIDDAVSPSPYNCVTLTPDLTTQRGCAWDANSTLNFLANFTYEIDVNLGSNDGGADGMAFVIQNDPLGRCKCGTAGGALGAGGITNSLTVELDTYINFEDRDDFIAPLLGCAGAEDPDHIDMWFGGVINPDLDGNCDGVVAGERTATPNAKRLQNPVGTNYNIENGLSHKFRISWNAGTTTLTATVLNTALTITYATISSTFNPITVFGTNTPYLGFTASTGGLSNTQSFCLPVTLLSVEMTEFKAVCADKKSKLSWNTLSERGNDKFILERSCDGVNFELAQIIQGAGNSNSLLRYEYIDPTPCTAITYYRLSQVDLDGASKVLGVKSNMNCLSNDNVLIYPNPANTSFTVKMDGITTKEVVILNALGQNVGAILSTLSSDEIGVDTQSLGEALYFVQIKSNTETIIKKISIKH